MPESNIITIILVIIFAAALAYKSAFLKNKYIGRFTIHQVLYLVVIPGFIYTFFFAYIQSVLRRPLTDSAIAPDGLLVNTTLVAALYCYGGAAIHSISKMLSEALKTSQGPAKELNKYFHMNFSHNFIYSSAIAVAIGITLLEINHPYVNNPSNPLFAIARGIILGVSVVVSMYWYTSPKVEEHLGRWSDLKTTFLSLWIGLLLIVYAIKKTNPALTESDLLLTILVGFSIIAALNLILVYKRIKRRRIKITFHLGKIKKLLFETKL